ncbi:MAG: phosphoglucosamine mutase [Bdellovibrionales bacterium]|nr:phosphoglucosamine mutase [Bdellovibrionales bacterium]
MRMLFGTDGIRGVANVEPMDSETMLRLGRAAAAVFRRGDGRHRILIGKDTRISGYMLETALCSGFSSMGVDVLLVGPLPTPGVAFMTRSMRADAGVMISASHNSYEDNGIKFFGNDGFKLADTTEAQIEELMEPGHVDELRAVPETIGKAFRLDDAIGRYTVYLKSCLPRETSLEGVHVVLDSANGAAYRVAPMVFRELGAKVTELGDDPDGKNINLNCGSVYPENMVAKVRELKADFGVAFDGDGDRAILCDETGALVDGDLALAILATERKSRGELPGNAVVGTVMSNYGLEVSLRERGIELYRAAVGDRYVLQEMRERGLVLGGEQSGHLISLDHNTTGDGLLTALLIASVLRQTEKPLSYFQTLVRRFPQELINVRVREKRPFEEIPEVAKALQDADRSLNGSGRVVLRYSGTEMKVRVMVECSDAERCRSIAQGLANLFRCADERSQ